MHNEMRVYFSCERCGAPVSRPYRQAEAPPNECFECEAQDWLRQRDEVRQVSDRLLAQVFGADAA
jgi:hypothetical protein